MERTTKPKLKLIDLYNTWRKAQTAALIAAGGMSITPALLKEEQKTYKEFYEALTKCNC